MKKIVLDFYSCHNLGDDLFVWVFSKHFSDCRIRLLANPKCIPTFLPQNVRVHPYSYPDLLLRKLTDMSAARGKGKTVRALTAFRNRCLDRIGANCDAFVKIGGSIFMQHTPQCPEIDFSTREKPDFACKPGKAGGGNRFVIGANLGPVYTGDYWEQMEREFRKYRSVCLRDYASYCKMRNVPNVRYAPDVLFLLPVPKTAPREENVVFSVMDIGRYTADQKIVDAYFHLLEQAIGYFLRKQIPVTLVSFCQWQGDAQAIEKLMQRFPGEKGISACCYEKNPDPVLEALAGADFIVGSRFHSTILGISFGKPVFPIIYNSKTAHYLSDLPFSGKSVRLEDLPAATLEDLLYNYTNRLITDCTDHRRYAENQFADLRCYLEKKEREIESNTV